MVRLSDLIGDKNRPKETPRPTPPPQAPSVLRPAAPAAPAAPAPPAVARRPAATRPEGYYVTPAACVKELFQQARSGQPLQLEEAALLTQQLPKLSPGQYDEILILDERHPGEHYLINHSVHVAFLVNRLAYALGYTSATSHQLSLAGLLI